MYIPYGGPVIFNVPTEERNKIRYLRNIEKAFLLLLISLKNQNFIHKIHHRG